MLILTPVCQEGQAFAEVEVAEVEKSRLVLAVYAFIRRKANENCCIDVVVFLDAEGFLACREKAEAENAPNEVSTKDVCVGRRLEAMSACVKSALITSRSKEDGILREGLL